VRVSELSQATGVPVPTIKYYLREGLLPRGETTTSPNQASYGDAHVTRLRLIRSLLDVGGLSVATVRDVLLAVDDPDTSLHDVLGRTVRTVTAAGADPDDEHHARARTRLDALVADLGWQVSAQAPARAAAVSALATIYRLGLENLDGLADVYARAAEQVAEADLGSVARVADRDLRVQTALVGTVVGDALLAALRRMAQEHTSAKHFPPEQEQR
jgi:DNA-binding transcriptional MerR regulator